jgi:hypothetical protein
LNGEKRETLRRRGKVKDLVEPLWAQEIGEFSSQAAQSPYFLESEYNQSNRAP